jgi:hypothetical protein
MCGSAPSHLIQGITCRHFADVRLSKLKMSRENISMMVLDSPSSAVSRYTMDRKFLTSHENHFRGLKICFPTMKHYFSTFCVHQNISHNTHCTGWGYVAQLPADSTRSI